MEEPARHILFHGVIILLFGLLAGIPYARSIIENKSESVVLAWRVAHSALSMGAILMLSLVSILPLLNVNMVIKWIISVLIIVSGYAFSMALYLGPCVGHRGLSCKGPVFAKVVYLGNTIGAATSMIASCALLFSAWQSLNT
ncbi:MAG: hypothetical protein JMN24_17385 [gamma proteobacterium endosymbiont of Lamellibrachia anaximandri]|nr:hypothetical protein [gamma proteobacterium endosymbiont of Lamellibrachia anaximandri]